MVAREYLTRFINRDEVVMIDIGEVDELDASIGNRTTPCPGGFRAQVVKSLLAKTRARCWAL